MQSLSWEQLKTDFASLNLIQTNVVSQTGLSLPPSRDAEASLVETRDSGGRQLALGYTTTCDPSRINFLKVNGQDLRIADSVSFAVGAVEWKAGEGWPIYRSPNPIADYNNAMRWNAYMHSIIIGCLHDNNTYTFTAPYAAPGVYRLGPGRIVAFVNDDQYGDNRGYFNIEVYGWS